MIPLSSVGISPRHYILMDGLMVDGCCNYHFRSIVGVVPGLQLNVILLCKKRSGKIKKYSMESDTKTSLGCFVDTTSRGRVLTGDSLMGK